MSGGDRIEYRRTVTISLFDIEARMGQFGLGHVGVLPVSTYNETAPSSLSGAVLAPAAQSVLVFASTGSRLWDSFVEEIRKRPETLTASQHPLDDFVQRSVHEACADLCLSGHSVFFADQQAPVHLDFRSLAVAAGIGSASRLGLVIHPKYGPWMGLRAAIFVQEEFLATDAIEDVCAGCPAPCIAACPGDAMTTGQWEVGACVEFHQQSEQCSRSCHSRNECIVGADARYDSLEILYHYNRRLGREALRRHLGIESHVDLYEGVGPEWGPLPQSG